MAQSQTVTPDTLPANFGQWDSSPDTLPENFNGFDSPKSAPAQPETQSSAVMRFLKAAGSKYLGATLNAGPTTSTPGMYGTPEWQQAEQAMYDRYKSGQKQPGLLDYLKSASLANVPDNALKEVKNLNPIDMQKFDSGDVAGGLGSTAMNLLMLRQAWKGLKGSPTPEFNAPNTSEIVQPLSGYSKATPQPPSPATSAPAQAPPSNSILPNATYLQPEMRALTSAKTRLPDEINKNTNTLAQEYFIQKMREQMNRQTVTGSAEQDAVMQRMADYAKTPVDKMQGKASGPVSSPQYAYRTRDAGETGIMPNAGKTAQASLDPAKVQSYMPGRAQAQNAAQELVRVDLSRLDPSEYEIQPNGYVKFKGAVPESFIEKVNPDAPRVPTSDADLMNLLMQSIQKVKGKARAAGK